MTDYAYWHRVSDTALNSSSLVLNLCLLCLIISSNELRLKVYKWILLITCVSDIVFAIVTLIAQPVTLIADGHFLLFANGFFAGRNRTVDFVTTVAFPCAMHANLICLVLQFIFRYLHVGTDSGELSRKSVTLIALVAVLWWSFEALVSVVMLYESR
ncbi:hypothetical protein AAVH_12482 [Aphelenchoides avenae]|nr:hypothetical protein AAVH_12482 [Aphelenchus avenae]